MQRTGLHTARWNLTNPCSSVTDSAGFEIAGNGSVTADLSVDGLSVAATYTGAVVVGQAWQLDDGSLDAVPGLSVTGQRGVVT